MTDPPPVLLTIAEAARRLGVDRNTLRRWITAGHVRANVIGSRRWVSRAEVDRLLRAREEQS